MSLHELKYYSYVSMLSQEIQDKLIEIATEYYKTNDIDFDENLKEDLLNSKIVDIPFLDELFNKVAYDIFKPLLDKLEGSSKLRLSGISISEFFDYMNESESARIISVDVLFNDTYETLFEIQREVNEYWICVDLSDSNLLDDYDNDFISSHYISNKEDIRVAINKIIERIYNDFSEHDYLVKYANYLEEIL